MAFFPRAFTLFVVVFLASFEARADPAFDRFIQSLWPQAQQLGVSKRVFDANTRGLEPDLSLPDLEIPGKKIDLSKGQAEFIQSPEVYVSEKAISNLAARGRKLREEHAATLNAIEQKVGVPGPVILAIWGRETAFGGHQLKLDGIRTLATQAYLGRRKEQFREEFLYALKMIEDGHAKRADMKSSWAGAMGHTQFLPSDFYRHGVDFDGDGKIDVFNSIPDALASAARQLAEKGWKRGVRWAYETHVPPSIDCTIAEPGFTQPMGEWSKRGYTLAYGRKLSPAEANETASLLMPAGLYGPAFLTTKNYYVLKDYNFSDLYVLFVGHLADRIAGGRPFERAWDKVTQLQSGQVEEMQRILLARGMYADKLDGKAGMLTRSALGKYQKTNGLKLDCWPTSAVLQHMRGR
jgi:lytic murein transglycosylase